MKETEQVTDEINDPLFINMTEFDENIKAKRIITLNLPVQVWHDFYDKFVDRSDFEYCEMDTDSPYTAFSSNSLEEIVIHLLMDINHGLYNFCADVDIEEDNFTHWLQCCDKNNLYDTKTPEVFKTEFF